VDKLFLKFPHSWWSKNTTGFSFLWSDDDREQFIKENKVSNHYESILHFLLLATFVLKIFTKKIH